jgi:plastocyanin
VFKRLGVVSVPAALAALAALAFVSLAHAQSAVNMTAVEFAFQPATVNTASGSVTFNLRNNGQFPHNIAIDGRDGSIFANDLTAGQSATATVNLPPGTYTFYCPVDGHRDRGMVGTLTVAGAQAARAGGLDPIVVPAVLAILGGALLAGGFWRRRSLAQG